MTIAMDKPSIGSISGAGLLEMALLYFLIKTGNSSLPIPEVPSCSVLDSILHLQVGIAAGLYVLLVMVR